ncbi:hypothetical protein VTK56DRAFT_5367 [Thermocarpiscus australiensis]
MSSNASTPNRGLHPSQTLPPPSPSPLAADCPLTTPEGDVPSLSIDILTTRADKVAALKLIADSIAQQRQEAAWNLVSHPLLLAPLVAVLAAIYRYAYVQNHHDLGTAMMLSSSAIMTYLLAIRYLTAGYLHAAESLSWDFLTAGSPTGEEDLVIGTRFGSDLIGALVLRLERPAPSRPSSADDNGGSRSSSSSSSSSRRKSPGRASSFKGGQGIIRAWTTKLRYRRHGVGRDMLREAVRVTRQYCGGNARVGFARDHANSAVVLPEMFNKPFRKREMEAARVLEEVVVEWEGRRPGR